MSKYLKMLLVSLALVASSAITAGEAPANMEGDAEMTKAKEAKKVRDHLWRMRLKIGRDQNWSRQELITANEWHMHLKEISDTIARKIMDRPENINEVRVPIVDIDIKIGYDQDWNGDRLETKRDWHNHLQEVSTAGK